MDFDAPASGNGGGFLIWIIVVVIVVALIAVVFALMKMGIIPDLLAKKN